MKDHLKIHFSSEILQTVVEETNSEMYTSEIIMKDQVLISKTPVAGTAERAEKIALVPGQHTTLSEDGNALIALSTDYPQIKKTGKMVCFQSKLTWFLCCRYQKILCRYC